MKTSDFYYNLPDELIAQTPSEQRDMSRLLVLDRQNGNIEHKKFIDVTDYFNEGDCLVLNNTRVIPARLYGKKKATGGKIEFVLLKDLGNDTWEVILRPGKKAKIGAEFEFAEGRLVAKILDIIEEGNRIVKFSYNGIFNEILDEAGIMPLPPYIKATLEDKERYQTIYSKIKGSAAAPTAGLHFTDRVFEKLKEKNIEIAEVTLHVGLGTFRPVKVDNVKEHHMHTESYSITQDACDKINSAKKNNKRIISVGTTSTRVLETVGDDEGRVYPGEGDTDIFIYPGYKFKVIDKLITNFHLPESTLLMLVSALAGKDNILNAYKVAVEQKYRFFSFGDAMLIK